MNILSAVITDLLGLEEVPNPKGTGPMVWKITYRYNCYGAIEESSRMGPNKEELLEKYGVGKTIYV